jgi:hypothetical protein
MSYVFSADSISFEVNQDYIYFQRQHAGTTLDPPLTYVIRINIFITLKFDVKYKLLLIDVSDTS